MVIFEASISREGSEVGLLGLSILVLGAHNPKIRIVCVFEVLFSFLEASTLFYNPSHNPSPQSYYNPSPARHGRFGSNCAVTVLLQSHLYCQAGLFLCISRSCLAIQIQRQWFRSRKVLTILLQSHALAGPLSQGCLHTALPGDTETRNWFAHGAHNPTTILPLWAGTSTILLWGPQSYS